MRLKTSTRLAIASVMCRGLVGARRLVGLGSDVETTRDGIRWHLDLTEGIDLAIYVFGRFESQTVRVFRRFLRPGDVVVDIGANIGANTLELARSVGVNGRVIAFEPTEFAVAKLRKNLELNRELERTVTVEHAFLGDGAVESRSREFYASWPLLAENDHGLHQRHRGRLGSAENAVQWTLDGYVDDRRIESIRLIKLDVDGGEWSVLKGAQQTLERFHPMIVMEIAPYVLDEEPGALEGALEILSEAGYGFTDIATGKGLPVTASELRATIPYGASVNVLALTRT